MSFPRYESYKDSGVEWLGEVPQHWQLKCLRFLLKPSYEGLKIGPFGSQLTSQMLADYGCKVYGQENVIANDFKRGERFIPEEKFQELVMYEICPGDILITMMGTSGRCGIVPENIEIGIMDSHLLRMRVTNEIRANFLRLLIDESLYVAHQVKILGKGSIMHGLNSGIIKELFLTIPPIEEQDTLLAFLDRETAKIDALIAEQHRLIELLKEKRQAVISHAVTKGLNPDAPMKDSGIEWLGEIPKHWEFGPLKRFAEIIDCKHYTVEFLDEGLPIVSIREVRDNKIDLSNAKLTSQSDWEFLREGRAPKLGDLIFCRNASVGAVGYVNFETPFCMGQDVCLIRSDTTSRFIHYQLTSPLIGKQIEAFLVDATIRRANVEEIRNLTIVNPPETEQQFIALFLDRETAKLDTLTTEAQRAIELLQERRTALISAAVTGKIDVR